MLNKIKIPPCFTTKWYYDLGNVLSHLLYEKYYLYILTLSLPNSFSLLGVRPDTDI